MAIVEVPKKWLDFRNGLVGPNDVIAIPNEAILASGKPEIGQRNFGARNFTEPALKPLVKLIEWVNPDIEAIDISRAGAKMTKWGIKLQEHLNRYGIKSRALTMMALGLVAAGLVCDLVDGTYARHRRERITDPRLKMILEGQGQADDPEIDADVEAYQCDEAEETAKSLGSGWGIFSTRFTKATNNFARTAKAFVGMEERQVPEQYPLYDPIHSPGASLGRKWLYLATFKPRIELAPGLNIPVQEIVHTWVGMSNLIVTGERLSTLLQPPPPKEERLSPKEKAFAAIRAQRLLPISIMNVASALSLTPKIK